MIFLHSTVIDEEGQSSFGGVHPSLHSGAGPSSVGSRIRSYDPHIETHMCMTCGQSCYGHGPTHGTFTMTVGQVRTL